LTNQEPEPATEVELEVEAEAGTGGILSHPVIKMILSMVVLQGSLFLSGTLVFRGLGPEERGEAAMVTAAAAFWAHLAILGTPAALLYFVSNRQLDSRRMLRLLAWPMFWQATVCGLFACITFVLLTDFGRTVNYFWVELFFIMVGIYLFNTGSLCLAALQGEHRFTAFSVVNALPILIYAILVAVLFFSGIGNIPLYLTASSLGWSMVPIATWMSLRKRRQDAMDDLPTLSEVRKYGAKSAIATAAPTDQFGIEQLIVGSMLGHKSLGLWTAGWAFESGTVLPGNLLAGFVAPVVAAADPAEKKKLIWKWTSISLVAALLICAVLVLIMGWLLPFVFGPDAESAVGVARILVLAGVFLGWRRVLGVSLQAMGVPGPSTWAEVACFLTMVAAVVGLGSTFGLEGAAWGMVAGPVVGSILQVLMIGRTQVADLPDVTQEAQVG